MKKDDDDDSSTWETRDTLFTLWLIATLLSTLWGTAYIVHVTLPLHGVWWYFPLWFTELIGAVGFAFVLCLIGAGMFLLDEKEK